MPMAVPPSCMSLRTLLHVTMDEFCFNSLRRWTTQAMSVVTNRHRVKRATRYGPFTGGTLGLITSRPHVGLGLGRNSRSGRSDSHVSKDREFADHITRKNRPRWRSQHPRSARPQKQHKRPGAQVRPAVHSLIRWKVDIGIGTLVTGTTGGKS